MQELTSEAYSIILWNLQEWILVKKETKLIRYINEWLLTLSEYSIDELTHTKLYELFDERLRVELIRCEEKKKKEKFYGFLYTKSQHHVPIELQHLPLPNGDIAWIISNLRRVQEKNDKVRVLWMTVEDLMDIIQLDDNTIELDMQVHPIISLIHVFQNTLHDMQDLVERKKISCNIKVDDSIKNTSVLIDKEKIEEVLENLISAGIMFSKNKGYVNLEIKKEKNNVLFEVIDNWFWVTQYVKENLFSKNVHLKRLKQWSYRWSGLWIYVSKQILKAHDSDLDVSTRKNVWTVFHFSLPITK